MDRVVHKNRWLVWTLAICVSIALLTIAVIEFQKGEIDQETTYSALQRGNLNY